MIDPLARRNDGARRLVGLDGGATIALTPITLASFLHRRAFQRADRADAVGHLPTPARRLIWARISSI